MHKHILHFLMYLCAGTTAFAFISACQPNKHGQTADDGVATDSTMIDTEHCQIKKIHVGPNITHHPLCSQLIEMDGAEKYAMMDKGRIYIFNWEKGTLEDSVSTEKCGNLANFSGFTIISADSVLVYNNADNTVFLINHAGDITAQYQRPAAENYTTTLASVTAINHSRMQWAGGRALLHGNLYGCMNRMPNMRVAISEWADMNEGKGKVVAHYPALYGKKNWGGIYMNEFAVTTDTEGNTYYSFPISSKVLKYNADFTHCDTLLMKSRHDKGISPCKISPDKLEEDDSQDVRYYLSQPSYRHILFDTRRQLLIRTAEVPRPQWDGREAFVKTFTFIVARPDGTVLSESPLFPYSHQWSTSNMHLCKEGIAIAVDNKDEENIYFECFKIND